MRKFITGLWNRFRNSFFLYEFRHFLQKGDMILLVMCLTISAFSCLMIASATAYRTNSMRLIIIQLAATVLGVLAYAVMSSLDMEFFSEHRLALTAFSLFLLALLIPFGVDHNSGNKSWIALPLVPFDIQPAEICKISFILILASVMNSHQNRLSSIPSVLHMGFFLLLIVGVNMALSRDLGVSLIFVFIFIAMAFTGGVKLWWFALGCGALAAVAPFLWSRLSENQINRIKVIFDPTVDPQGIGPRWHFKQSLQSLTGGGITGQGLFNGNRTSNGLLQAQHTDFIFSAIGEELGYVGCALVIIALAAVVMRCIWVGAHSPDFMRRMVCYGSAAALIFQICINVGMNMGVAPVIGLTLPLISYGGSSVVSIYAMLGLVSGVHARPSPRSHERYIRPPM